MASSKYGQHKAPEFFDRSPHSTVIQNNTKSVTTKSAYCKELCVVLKFCIKNCQWPKVTQSILHTKCEYRLNSNLVLIKKQVLCNQMHQYMYCRLEINMCSKVMLNVWSVEQHQHQPQCSLMRRFIVSSDIYLLLVLVLWSILTITAPKLHLKSPKHHECHQPSK